MRIVIDLQGAQTTGSRNRGIGRYSLALADGIVRQKGAHDVILALNGLFPETIDEIRGRYTGSLPASAIRVWYGMPGVAALGPAPSAWRRSTSELLREAFIASLRPDVVLFTSFAEGLVDDAVTSIGELTPGVRTAVVVHDLIPLIHRKIYLQNPLTEAWYERKLAALRRADLLLANSESTRQETLQHLRCRAAECVTISAAAESRFRPVTLSAEARESLLRRHGLMRRFVMYTGGTDHRKNVDRLIGAFARLPQPLRNSHQLAIVGSVPALDQARLSALATSAGLAEDSVVYTGFVSDDALIRLYNACDLFVFPPWHEGFGLPALEAMACGRAVIAANAASLPEVVGRNDVLFDPFDEAAIADRMSAVLGDAPLRAELERFGLERSRLFSWDATAARALRALEALHGESQRDATAAVTPSRPRLAFVSPLPPERTGISSYVAELLPELMRHYDIELVSTQSQVADGWALRYGPLRTPDWFVENAARFDRVLYQFGNSEFHRHMFALLDKVPGIVVLHDFFLGHLIEHLHGTGLRPGEIALSLYRNHGYGAVNAALGDGGVAEAVWTYPCNLDVLQRACGVIVHSDSVVGLARRWYGEAAAHRWAVVPHLRAPVRKTPRDRARRTLGFADDDFVVCSFGIIGTTKLSHRLVAAWAVSALARDPRCKLVFVGANDAADYGDRMVQLLQDPVLHGRVSIAGWIDDERYRLYSTAIDAAVQLRTRSRGEFSGAVLDCLGAGVATIVNRHGTFADLAAGTVLALDDDFDDGALAAALESLHDDAALRAEIGACGKAEVEQRHSPRHCARLYAEAIERMHADPSMQADRLMSAAVRLPLEHAGADDWLQFARAAAQSLPPSPAQRQLFVDVSILMQVDARTGIQRVVRSVLRQWLTEPPQGWRIEPVYAATDGYRYARQFAMAFLGAPAGLADGPIDAYGGDVFVALDLNPNASEHHLAAQRRMRDCGVSVQYVVYDLLPVLLPHRFWSEATRDHQRWLGCVADADRAICISRAVADELYDWLRAHGPKRPRGIDIDWFHLGSDLEASMPSAGISDRAERMLSKLAAGTSLLMVGTIEPRKCHAQVLDAMELLWFKGDSTKLAIVGKPGWNVEPLVERLRTHKEAGRRLFWFDSASDEVVLRAYQASDGLIAASEGEGFGLNLVEAARHGLPILARDIPVFREVADAHATFFVADEPHLLATAISRWAVQLQAGGATPSTRLPLLTWKDSADMLLQRILSADPYRRWQSEDTFGADAGSAAAPRVAVSNPG